jgi:predicted metal-dependent hydrolase
MFLRFSSTSEELQFEQWTVKVLRKAFRRHLTLQVKSSSEIVLKVNRSLSERVLRQFVLEKKDWLEKSLRKYQEHESQAPKV